MALTPEQESHVIALTQRSGVKEQLAQEAETRRAAEETALRAELAKNEAQLAARGPKLKAAVDAADAREAAARKESQSALEDFSKARDAQSQFHEQYWAVRNGIEPQLRLVADPRINALAKELRDRAKDPKRNDLPHEERARRVRATFDLADAAERLTISPSLTADKLSTELDRILNASFALWRAEA